VSLRSHHGRSNQPPLAPFAGKSAVRDCRADVKALHGSAPTNLSQPVRVADLPGRRSLRSACTNHVSKSRPSDRLNNLPDNVTSASSLPTFRQRLKNFLFPISFPDIVLANSYLRGS